MFEIKVPYTTLPHMVRATGPLFTKTTDFVYRKSIELHLHKEDLYGTLDSTSEELIEKACLKCEVPHTKNIVDFALNFEEDVAIIHKGKLNAICFCFPSSWVPRERLGKSLGEIHTAVADSDKLVNASEKIAKVMCEQPFERYVWTISNCGSLSQHPQTKNPNIPKYITDLYFRVEKQTSMPLDEDSSLFFVHVSTRPLDVVFEDEEMKQKIVDSINSMSYNILRYKNLEHVKNLLNEM